MENTNQLLHDVETGKPVFFPISIKKLLVLFFCSLGLYQVYWFYKNWQIIRVRTSEDISPVPRAIFALFFIYSLLERIKNFGTTKSAKDLAVSTLFVLYLICTFAQMLPDPFWLAYLLAVIPLVSAQIAINDINEIVAPMHDKNSKFSIWNWVMIVIGGLLLILAVYGTIFLPTK